MPKIDKLNTSFAIRMRDILILDEQMNNECHDARQDRLATSVKGKGQYRRWAPQAVLRATYGRPWAPASLDQLARGTQPRRRHMSASSASSVADFFEAGTSHINRTRQAVAFYYMTHAVRHLELQPHVDTVHMQVSFDTSEQFCDIEGDPGIYEMLMMHVDILFVGGALEGRKERVSIPVPPAFLYGCDASSCLNAILTRLPLSLEQLLRRCRVLWFAMGTDSHRACLKIARHFRRKARVEWRERPSGGRTFVGLFFTHGRCMQHILGNIVGDLLRLLGVLSPMFCGCCLLQKGGTKRHLKKIVHRQVDDIDIDVVNDAPPEHEAYLRALMRQMDHADDDLNALIYDQRLHVGDRAEGRRKRAAARDRLSRNLAHSDINAQGRITKLRHGCKLGCHPSRQEAVKEIKADLDEVQLDVCIGVPAINRWLKLHKPNAYWENASQFGYVSDAIHEIVEVNDDLDPMVDADTFGIGTENTFHKKKQRRFRCVDGWLSTPDTGQRLGVGSVIISPILQHMGYFFNEAKGDVVSKGLLPFCVIETSPAVKVIQHFFDLLGREMDEFWLPVRGPQPWSAATYGMVSSQIEKVIARIYLSMVVPFAKRWPGKLGQVGSAHVSLARQREVCMDLMRCRCGPTETCLEKGVAEQVRSLHHDVDELLGDTDLLASVRSGLSETPAQNIQNENRFSRAQCYTNVQRGKAINHCIVAARHVLPETQIAHRRGMKRLHAQVASEHVERAPLAKKFRNGYCYFLSEKGLSAKVGHVQWAALAPAEQKAYGTRATEANEDPVIYDGADDYVTLEKRLEMAVTNSTFPLNIASVQYPLANDHAAAATVDVHRGAAAWRELVGVLFGPNPNILDADPTYQCCELYGERHCKYDFNQDERGQIDRMKRTFRAATKLPQVAASGVPCTHLLRVVAPGVAAAHDDPNGAELSKIFFLSSFLLNPIFEMAVWAGDLITPPPLQAGSIIEKPLTLDALSEVIDPILELFRRPHVRFELIDYTYVRMTRVVVNSCNDVTEELIRIARGPEIDEEIELLKKIAKMAEGKRVAKRRQEALDRRGVRVPGRGAGRGRGRGAGRGAAGRGDGNDDEYGSGDSAVHRSDAPLSSDVDDDWRSCDDGGGDENAKLPVVVPDEEKPGVRYFCHPSLPDVHWARETTKNIGARSEAKAIYCYLHGCSKMRKGSSYPTDAQLQKWLVEGSSLPRSAENKRLHEREFDKMYPS